MPVRLPDRDGSSLLLIGTGTYVSADLPDLPAVHNNLQGLAAALTDAQHGGIRAANCRIIDQPTSPMMISRAVRELARDADDTLIVYFAGHGIAGRNSGELFLALPDSDPEYPAFSALRYDDLRNLLVTNGDVHARNRVVILDCCFSGRAIPTMSAAQVGGLVDIEGVYVLTATARNQLALAPGGEQYTAFSGALLELLRHGIADGPELLSLGVIYERLNSMLKARGLPRPEQVNYRTAAHLALARNPAFRLTSIAPAAEPPQGLLRQEQRSTRQARPSPPTVTRSVKHSPPPPELRPNASASTAQAAGYVFISYSHKDADFATRLVARLDALGIATWINRERLDTGDRWLRVIRDKVDGCAALVVIMTPESEDSEWVEMEIARARAKRRPILPMLVSGSVFFSLGAMQYDVVGRDGEVPPTLLSKILAITGQPQPEPPRAEPPTPTTHAGAILAAALAEYQVMPVEADANFVGRHEQQAAFLAHLASPGNRTQAFHFVGPGGIGKSALLRLLLSLAAEQGMASVYVDLGFVQSPLDLLRKVAFGLIRQGCALPRFQQQIERYVAIDLSLRASGLDRRLVSYVSKVAEMLPVAGQSGGGPVGDQIGAARRFDSLDALKVQEALPVESRGFFTNPLPILTGAFVEDVSALRGRAVIALDRTERLAERIGESLWNDMLLLARNATVLTAGRNDISRVWRMPLDWIRLFEVGPLKVNESTELLQAAGITDPAVQIKIHKSTRGIPLAVVMATTIGESLGPADVPGTVDAYVVNGIVKVFLEELDKEQRELLQQFSIFRRFNREMLAVLNIHSEAGIEALLAIRFMKHVQSGFAVHDVVRDFVLRDLHRHQPRTHSLLHTRAATYYRARIGPSVEGDPNFLDWLYHTIAADPGTGFAELKKYFTAAAMAVKPDLSDAIVGVAREGDTDGSLPALWLRYFEGAIRGQRFQFAEAAEIYEELLASPDIERDRELKGELLFQWSTALWYLGRSRKAISFARESMALNEALEKSDLHHRSIGIVGIGLGRMGRFDEALDMVGRMETLSAQNDPLSTAYALNSKGYFSWMAGRWRVSEKALLECRSRWIALENPLGECYPITHLGLLYAAVRKPVLAWDLLNTSRRLCEVSGNLEMLAATLLNLSGQQLRAGHGDEAQGYALEAQTISSRLRHPFFAADSARLLAEVYFNAGDLMSARQTVVRGLALIDEGDAVYLQSRMDALNAAIEVQSTLQTRADPDRVLTRLTSLVETNDRLGFRNVTAYICLAALRLALGADPDDLVVWFRRGVARAFEYNWYVGMEFLEHAKDLFRDHGIVDGPVYDATVSPFSLTRLSELLVAPGSHSLQSFHADDLARASAFIDDCATMDRAGRPILT
jgi:tetratricopeptide (TPR) repeat protein